MKKIIYLVFLAIGMTGCSVESLDSGELLTADASVKPQEVGKSMNLLEAEICAGEAPVFVFNFPQNFNGPNSASTSIAIQIETFPGSGLWGPFKTLSYAGAGPVEYTYNDAVLAIGTYSFRVSIGAGGFSYAATLNVVECSDCEESFSYSANGGNSYTFSYTPAEDMTDASLVFTFAQSVAVSGLDSWTTNGQTKQISMDLDACTTYEWTVELLRDCSGNSNNSNVWTDFNVNGNSKKGELDNITQSCNN